MQDKPCNKYHLGIVQQDIVKPTRYFCQIYRSIIQQKYNTFPVPDKLINDMVDFCLQNQTLKTKTYQIKNIVEKYCKNWKYYHIFKFNLQKMLAKNKYSNITIVKFKTQNQITYILKKYPPQLSLNITLQTNAIIYDYTKDFNLCLAINSNHQSKFYYYKSIQHQLIHWMQIILNIESGMSNGIFNDFTKSICESDLKFLYQCFGYSRITINTINYILSSMQFQAWCANTIENFQYSGFNLYEFENIIKNRQLFKTKCQQYNNDQNIIQLLMFTQICYLASLSNPSDDRYWYLIEAIKENIN